MKIAVLLIFLSGCYLSVGQEPTRQRFLYGYSIGMRVPSLNIGIIQNGPGAPYAIPSGPGFGIEAGAWGAWHLFPTLLLRSTLNLSYTTNSIRFRNNDGQEKSKIYPAAELVVPVHFMLSSPLRRLPVHSIIIFGGRISWNLLAPPRQAPVQLLPERLGLDLGIGAGFRWGKWSVQPELLYSFGVNNLHNFTNSEYDWAIGRITRDEFVFRLTFGKIQKR